MSIHADILSFMDLLDLDEEIVDTRLKTIMVRDTYTNKHLKNAIQLLQYKQLINFQEDTDCENEDECTFLVKLINQLSHENAAYVCKTITIVLGLNNNSLVNNSEHLLQQILTEDPTLLSLQLCDSVLDAVIKTGKKLMLPFLELPVSSILFSPDEQLRINFLTITVPKLFEGLQGYSILDVIWNTIKEVPNERRSMALKIFSCLSEYYIPAADKQGKVSFQSEVVYKVEFWKIIFFGMCCHDPMIRRISVYLGKRAIDYLVTGKRCITISTENVIFSWDSKKASDLKNEWDNFFILMDSLEEKQSNIILPSLHLFEKLPNLGNCWLDCPFNLGLQHDNAQVRLKCIKYKLNTSLKSLNEAVLLLGALNDNNIFDEIMNYETLKSKMLLFFSEENILTYILKALTLVKWGPVPLFHVTDVLAKLNIKGYKFVSGFHNTIIEVLKIPCNNVLLRKSIHINIFYFIEHCFKHIHWRELLYIYPFFQVKLPNEKITSMLLENQEIEKEKNEFLKSALELSYNNEILLLYLNEIPEDVPILVELLNEKFKKVQEIVNRQYSNRRECLMDVISMAMLYIQTKRQYSSSNQMLNKILSQETKLILQYMITLVSSDATLDIEEIVLISKILKEIEYEDQKESLLQMYKISMLLFTDERSSLDKVVLGLFMIHCLMENPILKTHYRHEMVAIQHLLAKKSFDSKQNSRLVNAFYEELCKTVYKLSKEDSRPGNTKDIIEFVERVTECGGYGCLHWILKIMNEILPVLFSDKDIKFDILQFVHRMWKEIEELKSNSQYGPCMEEFINLITQENLLDHPAYNNVITMYCSKIVENAVVRNTPLHFLVKKLKNTEINTNRGHLVYTICEILMYAPMPRKDQRITENLIINILQNPKYETASTETGTHFNFQIQYSAISILSKIKHPEIYQIITSYITNRIDEVFKNKQRYHGNSQAHRTLLNALQHMLYIFSLQPNLNNLDKLKDWCLELLAKLPHQPSVRICLEWFIALFYFVKGSKINDDFIADLDTAKIPITSQFIIIFYITKRKIKIKCTEEEYRFVLNYLLSNTMGPMYNVRLYAQCLSRQLYRQKESPECKYMMELVVQNCVKDKNCTKLDEDFFISQFDIVSNLTPSFIYYFVPNYTEIICENIYAEYIKDDLKIMNAAIVNFNEHALDKQLNNEDVFNYDYPKTKAIVAENMDGLGSIQKKYIPWSSMSDIDVCGVVKKKESLGELIVVASLIDKLPNLGGMARTSEVFGVKTYVVDSLRHLQDRQFQALSVSAEHWVNVEEVRPGAPLKQYLHSKKAEGYAIVAAEQTSTSCQLNIFKFPKKTVLLLGHEKEGIPCDMLPLMDHCVEVPQQGLVRSLNVHVTAAIFIWEYSRQHVL